jgi:hypothetical protein
MDTEEIAATKAALVAIDTAIAQAEDSLRTADPDRTASLTSMLVDLRAERTRLQFALINADSAAAVVAPVAAVMAMPVGMAGGAARKTARKPAPRSAASKAALKSLHTRLKAAAADQKVADAALAFGKQVRDLARALMVSDNPTKPKRRRTGAVARVDRAIGDNPTRPKRKTTKSTR